MNYRTNTDALDDRRPSVPRRCSKNLEQFATRSDVEQLVITSSSCLQSFKTELNLSVFRPFPGDDCKVTVSAMHISL